MSARRLVGGKLVAATHNPGKVREIGELLAPWRLEVTSAAEMGLAVPAETESTFEGNAGIKALAAAKAAGLPALADDSGLEVDELNGAPGVHTADWAETPGGRDFQHAMRRLWDAVQAAGATPPVRARFACALCLAWPDGHTETFRGVVEGRLAWPPRGDRGFGYDPMFVRGDEDLTFGEITPEEKHAASHRSLAFRLLADACFDPPPEAVEPAAAAPAPASPEPAAEQEAQAEEASPPEAPPAQAAPEDPSKKDHP